MLAKRFHISAPLACLFLASAALLSLGAPSRSRHGHGRRRNGRDGRPQHARARLGRRRYVVRWIGPGLYQLDVQNTSGIGFIDTFSWFPRA